MAKSLRIAALAGFAACAMASVADATPILMSTIPAANSVVTAPQSIRMSFNESIDARQSGVAVLDATGMALKIGKISTNSTNSRQLIAALQGNLPPGKYSVTWHVAGTNADKAEGAMTFEVKP